jgi:hypothetical protein
VGLAHFPVEGGPMRKLIGLPLLSAAISGTAFPRNLRLKRFP